MGFFSFFSKEKKETLDKGLSKTKESVFGKIARAVAGKSKVDDEVLDNLEEVLITSDVGVETTLKIIERIEKRAADEKYMNAQELNMILRDEIAALLTENNSDDVDDFETPITKKPYVMKIVGIQSVVSTTKAGEETSHAVYPRASKVLRIPPLGKEEASGSCCTSSLPVNSSIMPPLPSCSTKASCFSAVPSVSGANQ